MNWLLEKLDKWAEKTERKLMCVNAFGDVIMYRYCLLKQKPNEEFQIGFKPNVYLHVWKLEEVPDGGTWHNHPGDVLSFMIKGEYHEGFDSGIKIRKPLSTTFLKTNEQHRLLWIKPDTVTLFFKWFSTAPMVMKIEPCKNVCEWCSKNEKEGKCFVDGKILSREMVATQFDNPNKDKIKVGDWLVVNEASNKWLRVRKKAIEKLGIVHQTAEDLERNKERARLISKLPERYYESVGNMLLSNSAREERLKYEKIYSSKV